MSDKAAMLDLFADTGGGGRWYMLRVTLLRSLWAA